MVQEPPQTVNPAGNPMVQRIAPAHPSAEGGDPDGAVQNAANQQAPNQGPTSDSQEPA